MTRLPVTSAAWLPAKWHFVTEMSIVRSTLKPAQEARAAGRGKLRGWCQVEGRSRKEIKIRWGGRTGSWLRR